MFLGLDTCRDLANLLRFRSLATVNFFLGLVGIVQVSRIFVYQRSQKTQPIQNAAEEVKEAVQS